MSNFRSAIPSRVGHNRIADQIYKDLRDQIVQGALPRGGKLLTEKELADHYQVSGPTVREAISGLTAAGLVEVRHGSGAYVTARAETLVAMSLGALMQLESVGIADVLGVVSVLEEYAARLAAQNGTKLDRQEIKAGLQEMGRVDTGDSAARALRNFHYSLAKATHNPLLAALLGFLGDLQVELMMVLTGAEVAAWLPILSALAPVRARLVDAIVRGNADEAAFHARIICAEAAELLIQLPKALQARVSDPNLGELISSMLTRIGPRQM